MADNGSNSTKAVQVARPVILVGGQEDVALAQGLLGMLVVENTTGLYRCEARFGNWGNVNRKTDFLYFDRSKLDFGKAFQVKFDRDVVFEGRIMGLEAHFPEGKTPEITVLAEDRFQDLRMTRRTRTFQDASDSDVFNRIANDHGLSPNVSLSGPTHKVLAQVNQSDLAFLRERARANDVELWMDGSTLNARPHPNRDRGTLKMSYGKELREFSVLGDLAGQRTSVTVSGWDVAGKQGVKYEATQSTISSELNGNSSGASILRSAIGERKEAVAHTVPITSQEAQAEAEAYFKLISRRFLTGRGVAQPSARLRVGAYVDLEALGPLFNGKYYVSEIRHIFGGSKPGMRTEFTAERPWLGRSS